MHIDDHPVSRSDGELILSVSTNLSILCKWYGDLGVG